MMGRNCLECSNPLPAGAVALCATCLGSEPTPEPVPIVGMFQWRDIDSAPTTAPDGEPGNGVFDEYGNAVEASYEYGDDGEIVTRPAAIPMPRKIRRKAPPQLLRPVAEQLAKERGHSLDVLLMAAAAGRGRPDAARAAQLDVLGAIVRELREPRETHRDFAEVGQDVATQADIALALFGDASKAKTVLKLAQRAS